MISSFFFMISLYSQLSAAGNLCIDECELLEMEERERGVFSALVNCRKKALHGVSGKNGFHRLDEQAEEGKQPEEAEFTAGIPSASLYIMWLVYLL
ncbi:rCG42056 [Rattus norvegicus]|uniref:RCG42056 n=1 Tax=Rattus norvegicus TaxID=10116 RepID=A6JUZ3_RAT|nr:rCG42056 [Rattus norvegicus]